MTWKLKEGVSDLGIPGIGPGPFTDSEFSDLVDEYEKREGTHAKGSVKKSGLYEHVAEAKAEAKEGKD